MKKAGGDRGGNVCNSYLHHQGSKNGICYWAPCKVAFIPIMQIRFNGFQIWKKTKIPGIDKERNCMFCLLR